jgi:hypothetical protein
MENLTNRLDQAEEGISWLKDKVAKHLDNSREKK